MIKLEAGIKCAPSSWYDPEASGQEYDWERKGRTETYGQEFDWDHKGRTEISHIYISHDFCIRFIQFQYVEENGVLSKLSPVPLKNSNGQRFNVVTLAYPDEFLKGISGWWDGNVTSLTFTTNRDTYGPFGRKKESDTEFNFQTGDEPLFSGFHGSIDDRGLRTIGIYVNPEHARL